MPRLPIKGDYPKDWPQIAERVKRAAGGKCVRCGFIHSPQLGRTLTVHHFDGDKGNCEPWNLMALCQACHLSVQGRVNPDVPLLTKPSVWSMPYIAGFYLSGRGMPGPLYDLDAWKVEYEASGLKWPDWTA